MLYCQAGNTSGCPISCELDWFEGNLQRVGERRSQLLITRRCEVDSIASEAVGVCEDPEALSITPRNQIIVYRRIYCS